MDELKTLTEPNSKPCVFCKSSVVHPVEYGELYELEDVVTHYFCLLLSNHIQQNGKDDEGVLGFLVKDIKKGVDKGQPNVCYFCNKKGATIFCSQRKCKIKYHLPCGLRHDCMSQYINHFYSYCWLHRPKQTLSQKVLNAAKSRHMVCLVCYDEVDCKDLLHSLCAPCCLNTWFHRHCVQELALSAGYFFKCAKCNNVEQFQSYMQKFGIFVPERDAAWELEPNAYQDLLQRHDQCDANKCICPNGRKHQGLGTRWELVLCDTCGSQGIHKKCGSLKMNKPDWECESCLTFSIEYMKKKIGETTLKHELLEPHVALERLSVAEAESVKGEVERDSDSPTPSTTDDDSAHGSVKDSEPAAAETSFINDIPNIRPGPLSYKFKVLRKRIGCIDIPGPEEKKQTDREEDDDIIEVTEVCSRKVLDTIDIADEEPNEEVVKLKKKKKKKKIGPKSKTKGNDEEGAVREEVVLCSDEDDKEKDVGKNEEKKEGERIQEERKEEQKAKQPVEVDVRETGQQTETLHRVPEPAPAAVSVPAPVPASVPVSVSVSVPASATAPAPISAPPPSNYVTINGQPYYIIQDNIKAISSSNSVLTLQLTLPQHGGVDCNSLQLGIAANNPTTASQAYQQPPASPVFVQSQPHNTPGGQVLQRQYPAAGSSSYRLQSAPVLMQPQQQQTQLPTERSLLRECLYYPYPPSTQTAATVAAPVAPVQLPPVQIRPIVRAPSGPVTKPHTVLSNLLKTAPLIQPRPLPQVTTQPRPPVPAVRPQLPVKPGYGSQPFVTPTKRTVGEQSCKPTQQDKPADVGIKINNYFSLLTSEYDHTFYPPSHGTESVPETQEKPANDKPELEFIVEHYSPNKTSKVTKKKKKKEEENKDEDEIRIIDVRSENKTGEPPVKRAKKPTTSAADDLRNEIVSTLTTEVTNRLMSYLSETTKEPEVIDLD